MKRFLSGICLSVLLPFGWAHAHPHVFAEARMEVTATEDGHIDRLRHVWRFDDLFSATVTLEFDANADGSLDDGELEEVSNVVTESISEFGYFLSIDVDGDEIAVKQVNDMKATMEDGQLLLFFTAEPERAVALSEGPHLSVYDPTFYTAIEFYDEDQMVLIGAPSNCSHEMVVPDPDEAIAQNQQTLTEAFFNDPEGNDMSKIFATRMEVSCSTS